MPLNRRKFLKGAAWLPAVSILEPSLLVSSIRSFGKKDKFQRVRPGDPYWPSAEKWEQLNQAVKGNLIKPESPLKICRSSPDLPSCAEAFKNLKNPFYISDHPALTQIAGWHNAWASQPSVYAIAAKNTSDVVAAVNFARKNNLRLVVKGGGHSLLGTSNAPDSLLVWTRGLNEIFLHDKFIPTGCEGHEPVTAVTMGAGALWMDVYNAVTTKAGRYIQGAGCTTVGVAGLIQSGGFGSFSKKYGLAASELLEAEIVTADGSVKIVNACQYPDLFWALKGGGGGSFGVVTKLTLQTRSLPKFFGAVIGKIRASSDSAFIKLIGRVIDFYKEKLLNPHWGEHIRFFPDNTIHIQMLFQGLDKKEAKKIWRPLIAWIDSMPDDYKWDDKPATAHIPAKRLWDASFLKKFAPRFIALDDRPGASKKNFYWAGNEDHAGQFLFSYHSAWLSSSLLKKQDALTDALFSATRHWGVSLQFNKGLAGASQDIIDAAQNTAMNPAVLDAFALAIIAGDYKFTLPGVPGHEPSIDESNNKTTAINKAMDELRKVIPSISSYSAESNFFEKNWQRASWGSNYERLLNIKKKYDPDGLFFVYHGVGSEEWSDDGFTKVS
jgi:FAD/FMN-containing dehydrogenase